VPIILKRRFKVNATARQVRRCGIWATARQLQRMGVSFIDAYVGIFGVMPRRI
jgi:hypothetical protein